MRSEVTTLTFGMLIYGSNGDIEPMISLAQALAKSGHSTKLFIISINNRDYRFLNQQTGIDIEQADYPYERLADEDVSLWSGTTEERNALIDQRYRNTVDIIVEQALHLGPQVDVMVGPTYMLEIPCVAEKFTKPYISLRPFAGQVRTKFEAPYFMGTSEELDKLSLEDQWTVHDAYLNKYYRRRINRLRRTLDLPDATDIREQLLDSKWLNLITYSDNIYPPKPDWAPNIYQCGFFKSPSYIEWQIPERLAQFIADGAPPVYLTIGTMIEYEQAPTEFLERLLKVARNINRKVIFHANWPAEKIDGNVYLMSGFISYPELIPRCGLAVHHGGVGTVHLITEAGCPSVIISYGFEHPFNCAALDRLGILGGFISRGDFDEDKLIQMINTAIENESLKVAATRLSPKLKAENGLETAVALIEKTFCQTNIRPA